MDEEKLLSIPRDELVLLMEFHQILSMDHFKFRVHNRKILNKYSDDFPEFELVFGKLDEIRSLYANNPNYGWMKSAYRKTPDEVRLVEKEIRILQKQIQSKAKAIVKMYQKLKEKGIIQPEKPNPDKFGKRYQFAKRLADYLVSLWFVDSVSLFGSVSTGKEHETSDIDIFFTYGITGSKTPFPSILDSLINDFNVDGKIRLHLLHYSEALNRIDFYGPNLLLAEQKIYTSKLKSQAFKKIDFSEYYIDKDSFGETPIQYLLLDHTNDLFEVLVLHGDEELALLSARFNKLGRIDIITKTYNVDLCQRLQIDLSENPALNHAYYAVLELLNKCNPELSKRLELSY